LVGKDWAYRQQVPEGSAVLAVVEDDDAAVARRRHREAASDLLPRGETGLVALQKVAARADNLAPRVSREGFKGVVDVGDPLAGVGHDLENREPFREPYDGSGARGAAHGPREKIQAVGRSG
jgi:hypothetical protein